MENNPAATFLIYSGPGHIAICGDANLATEGPLMVLSLLTAGLITVSMRCTGHSEAGSGFTAGASPCLYSSGYFCITCYNSSIYSHVMFKPAGEIDFFK